MKRESKKHRRLIQKHMAEADLLDADLRVRFGADDDSVKPKEVRRLKKIAGSPWHPGQQQARDRLHEVLPKGRFVATVMKGR